MGLLAMDIDSIARICSGNSSEDGSTRSVDAGLHAGHRGGSAPAEEERFAPVRMAYFGGPATGWLAFHAICGRFHMVDQGLDHSDSDMVHLRERTV